MCMLTWMPAPCPASPPLHAAPVWGQQVTAVLMNASDVQWPLNGKDINSC